MQFRGNRQKAMCRGFRCEGDCNAVGQTAGAARHACGQCVPPVRDLQGAAQPAEGEDLCASASAEGPHLDVPAEH